MKRYLPLAISFLIYTTSFCQSTNAYEQSVNDWHKFRIEQLKKPNGWLNLEGLFWLHKGKNSFGQAEGSDCRYASPSKANVYFPSHLGDFIYEGDSVVWLSNEKDAVKVNDQIIAPKGRALVYKDKAAVIKSDYKQFSWNIIKREDKMGVRFRNLKAKDLLTFKDVDRFQIDSQWRLKAVLVQPVQDFLMITNVLGQTTPTKNAGKLVFTVQNQQYTLDVIDEGGKQLFIVFADQTSGKTTYGAGRFIDINKPDANGNTVIDFNLAYNPPCAFTPFATCPLPPVQNRLPFEIPVGEKNYGHH